MSRSPPDTGPPARGLHEALDALIYALSAYGVPLAIAAVTLLALAAWDRRYALNDSLPVALTVAEDRAQALTPADAMARLRESQPLAHAETRLSEAPFWFAFAVPPSGLAARTDVEFPSRHATAIECWNAQTLASYGRADRSGESGLLKRAKAGFVLEAGPLAARTEMLCRGTFSGPARIAVVQWPGSQFDASAEAFQRNGGLLEGGLLVLAAFVLVTAAVNRDWFYVLFAAWLVASLRLGALSAGWDLHWLGRAIPADWLLPARKLTIAAYFTLTYALFARLFRDDLARLSTRWPLRVAQAACLAVFAAAIALPFAAFLPVMWSTVGLGVGVIGYYLLRIFFATRSRVAAWYAGALGVVVATGVAEVVAAALGVRELAGALNSVTAALASSLMAALALAEQMRVERRERLQAQAALRATYAAIPVGLFTLTADGAFERVNPALAEMLGNGPAGVPAGNWRDYFEPGAWERLQAALAAGTAGELDLRGAGAEPKWFHLKAARTEGRIEGSLQDFTERHRATEQLRYLAENDPLTDVPNRRGIEIAFERAAAEAVEGRPLAVAYLDLDRFKLINDLFGHVAGDEVLRQVCRRVEGLLVDGQTLGRVGGDEFVIVFRGTPMAAAAATCRGIVGAIADTPFQTADKAFQVRASIGLAEVAGRMPVDDAIAVADRACRAAKSGAGEGLVVLDRESGAFRERAEELRLVSRLGTAGAPEGLFLQMQPILSLTDPYGSLNFEVLVRMREADGTLTPGGVIVAAAENNGRAAVIDRWVLARTLEWLERHHDDLAGTRFVNMNLSGASLNDERFVADAFSMLAASPRAAQRLCVEVTEGIALRDLDNTRRFIERVRNTGAKVALDDFGAGYTSFSYLKELPADAVKIDGSLIVNVNAHPANLAIVEAIVELGRNLGMKSIAEWAEDRATVQSLAEAGVDYVQGFAVSRAQDPAVVLGAPHSAAFITDPEVLAYVRDALVPGGALARLDRLGGRSGIELH